MTEQAQHSFQSKESKKRKQPQTNAISTIYAILYVITSSSSTALILAKIERSPNRNPQNPQSSESSLYKETLQILPRLQKNGYRIQKKVRHPFDVPHPKMLVFLWYISNDYLITTLCPLWMYSPCFVGLLSYL